MKLPRHVHRDEDQRDEDPRPEVRGDLAPPVGDRLTHRERGPGVPGLVVATRRGRVRPRRRRVGAGRGRVRARRRGGRPRGRGVARCARGSAVRPGRAVGGRARRRGGRVLRRAPRGRARRRGGRVLRRRPARAVRRGRRDVGVRGRRAGGPVGVRTGRLLRGAGTVRRRRLVVAGRLTARVRGVRHRAPRSSSSRAAGSTRPRRARSYPGCSEGWARGEPRRPPAQTGCSALRRRYTYAVAIWATGSATSRPT